MPQTRFTCHDKILGGYYADPETQCQMFHVCVKVGGVGVQDFRFLCPNSTAFDQEAQICANWADVDCEQAVLYYGSDNFDLYRLGSGFESKRAPLAEEDESTFHLQRAETGDIRGYKQTTVDQKARPDQPPNYTKQFETVTRGGTFNSHNHHSNHNYLHGPNEVVEKKKAKTDVTKKPIASYYTPTSTSTTTTTERYSAGSNDDSKQDLDDIFKGSHSSHFFSNRNGGREDDFVEQPARQQKPNDFNDFAKKSEATTIGKSRVTPTRSRRPPATSSTTSFAPSTSTTATPKATKKVTANSFYNTDFYDFSVYKSTTSSSLGSSTTITTPKPSQNGAVNRFNLSFNEYQTQLNVQPTTYNPNRLKSTTPRYSELNRGEKASNANNNEAFNKKLQKFDQSQKKIPPQNSSYVNLNEFSEFAKIKPQAPQPFQPKAPAKTFEAPKKSEIEPQYHRSRGQGARHHQQQPEPFRTAPTRAPNPNIKSTTETIKEKPAAASFADTKPRGFVSRGSINYKASTQRNSETYPTVSANNYKKFSTLVPKDKYDPTTFKPSTYKKPYENNGYQAQQTIRPQNKPQKAVTVSQATTPYTTANPYYNIDEDDGQYHPELYEQDFPRHKLNLQRSSTVSTTTSRSGTSTTKPQLQQTYQNPATHLKSQQQTSFLKEQSAFNNEFSDEDELFNTAQSLNFGAASINKLRADIIKAEKTSQQYNSHYNPLSSLTSPKPSTSSSTPASTSTTYFTYPSYSTTSQQTTPRTSSTYAAAYSSSTTLSTSTTTTTTTTRRPTSVSTSTTPYPFNITKSGKHADKKSQKKNESKKKTSKRPPHADEDTSYDYAYYDTDTLSESPQEYPEYEIQEFAKTRKN
uniref:Chitin-binding type-2 domain-containing protein n=1 Tax=Stomoxys calcitrans TaxID=35570 RepID=A0A1I8PEZ7_STOCA